ncbi:glycosyl hydrolase family 18 protein [Actinomycetospora sp. TBRC 11914]|uniref:glycosyl hydrolase family 18 protein n=1 Tax=Actinomycetospora sp. TBRC 11914 TaxID=2729387 RepID=UPI00145D3443|nr:glycosyl hydrolase family 18 protein [Actinomycetospora sp. TBRC 11914]NMO92383.1 peptidoglycan hydrolase [Actinomycetospora sp. TBRC 11914]
MHAAPQRRQDRLLVVALALAAIVALGAGVAVMTDSGSRSAATPVAAAAPGRDTVIASIPYWNLGPGAAAVEANPQVIDEISPWVYNLAQNGSVQSAVPRQDTASAAAVMAKLRAMKVPLMPSVSNMVGGDFSYDAVAPVLHDPPTMARNIASITQLAISQDYAGIDLDYEELQGSDRTSFTTFVQQLAGSLHAAHKTLSVALFAKVDDAGDDQRNVAQDYAAIGAAADEVRLMTYDYHWETSPPGPVAPASWVHDVLAYAITVIPPEKIVVGLDQAGYDWVGNKGTTISYAQAMALSSSHGVAVQWDPLSQSPWFRYTGADGAQHEVWFENAASGEAKRAVADSFGVHAVFLWMYAPPDPALWAGLAQHTQSPPTSRAPGGSG